MLNQALDDLVAVGYLAERDRVGADITCWAAVHGFSVLNVEGPLRGLTAADRDAALSTLLLGIDRAFGAGGSWPELAPVRLAGLTDRHRGPCEPDLPRSSAGVGVGRPAVWLAGA